jgi:hypothetical protein
MVGQPGTTGTQLNETNLGGIMCLTRSSSWDSPTDRGSHASETQGHASRDFGHVVGQVCSNSFLHAIDTDVCSKSIHLLGSATVERLDSPNSDLVLPSLHDSLNPSS